jgi:hypothetical protein
MTWQQDGAKIRQTNKVMQYLDGQFGHKMLTLEETPDFSPLNDFVW